MEKKTVTKYDRMDAEWAGRISGMDIPALIKKLPELKCENGFLTLRHFGRKYGISLEDFLIVPMEDDLPVTSNAKMNIYTLLWYSKPDVQLTGDFRPFESLRNAGPFGPAFRKGINLPFAAAFSGKSGLLRATFEELGGTPLTVSDVGYRLNAFDCIPVQFYFWDCDDEFPAQANMLFDYSCTDFIHVESIVTIASEALHIITHAAGLIPDRRAF